MSTECIKKCVLDETKKHCLGCGRTMEEIKMKGNSIYHREYITRSGRRVLLVSTKPYAYLNTKPFEFSHWKTDWTSETARLSGGSFTHIIIDELN